MPTDGSREQRSEDRGQTDDSELLRRYATDRSEAAFAELVRRHLTPVYAVALRQVGGDAHLAEDVAQMVFTVLARKAAALADRPVLGGWLYRATHFAARDVVRAERRRRAREQEAETMNESPTGGSAEVDWDKLRQVLDQMMEELREADRDAVWLRFFEGRSFAEVGAKLRLTENAARMRVERALEKLHAALARRGVRSTTAALATALAQQGLVAAPAGLAASVTGAAMAGATAGGGAGAWLVFLTMSKIKVGIVSALVIGLMVTGVVELRANRELRSELGALRAGGDEVAALMKESQRLNADLQKQGAGNPEAAELPRLRQRAAALKARPPGVVDAEMITAANWRDVGRATVEAANLTFHRAMFTRDLDTVAKFVSFDDDTPENRAAFMAHFSEAVRAKYRTPEQIEAAGFFGAGSKVEQSPDDAFQLLGIDDHVGGNGSRFGQKHVRVWYRMASGKEFEGSTRWAQTADGWAPAPVSLAKEWQYLVPVFDPATGDRLPPQAPADVPAKK